MKMSEIEEGMQVVTNDLPDTQVYKVRGTDGEYMVDLVYNTKDGKQVNGGFIDITYIKKPTKKQLSNMI